MNFPSPRQSCHLQTLLLFAALFGLIVSAPSAAQRPPQGPAEDGTNPALIKIAGEALVDSHAFDYLTELSDDIGPRVTGSPAGQRAIAWGLAKMRAIGLENVHRKLFGVARVDARRSAGRTPHPYSPSAAHRRHGLDWFDSAGWC